MNVVLILIIIVIIVVFIVIAIARSGIYASPTEIKGTNQTQTTEQQTQDVPINTFLTLPVWSKPIVYDPERTGQCTAYTFLAQKYVPANPSYEILNSGDTTKYVASYNYYGTNEYLATCIDLDQLFASTIAHECKDPQGISAGAGCILTVPTGVKSGNSYILNYPGQKVPIGTIEGDPTISGIGNKLYTSCVPNYLANNKDGSLYCKGKIGLIVPTYTPQLSYTSDTNKCITVTDQNIDFKGDGHYNVTCSPCDLSDQNQIFRMVRYTLNTDYTLTESETGNLAAIIHRATGFYLAPETNFIQQSPSEVIEGVVVTTTTSYYEFDRPIINYGTVIDKVGNIYRDSIKLILINPVYDLQRNGVYWLLQNQTKNPTINPLSTDLAKFKNVGVYPNQFQYTETYPEGLVIQSYFWNQSWNKFPDKDNNGNDIPVPVQFLPSDGEIVSLSTACNSDSDNEELICYAGSKITASGGSYKYTNGIVSDVELNISPQQIVFVPDFRLLPTVNDDKNRFWNYLTNSYSINMTSGDVPVLTPYRKSSSFNLYYQTQIDEKNFLFANVFLTLQNYVQNYNKLSDTQFILYSAFTQQVQIPVSLGTEGGNINYSKLQNPFNI